MDTINDRILSIVNKLFNGNVSAFCRATNIPQPTLKDIVSGRMNKPSYSVLEKILDVNGLNISAEWLLRGSGDMTNNKQIIGNVSNSQVTGVNVHGNGININDGNVNELLNIVKKSQEQIYIYQRHIDKLLSIIEKLHEK